MHDGQLVGHPALCPYCSTPFELVVDVSQGSHETWEDCPHCCCPIQLRLEVSPISGELEDLRLGRDDEVL